MLSKTKFELIKEIGSTGEWLEGEGALFLFCKKEGLELKPTDISGVYQTPQGRLVFKDTFQISEIRIATMVVPVGSYQRRINL